MLTYKRTVYSGIWRPLKTKLKDRQETKFKIFENRSIEVKFTSKQKIQC